MPQTKQKTTMKQIDKTIAIIEIEINKHLTALEWAIHFSS